MLNPPATRLGRINAVMGGAGTGAYHVRDFAGPLSIKFMVRGSGIWRSDAGVHHVEEGYFLVLNHRQTYSLEIAHGLPRESFCPFFKAGFVENIHRTLTTCGAELLDEPEAVGPALRFSEHLHGDGPVIPALLALRRATSSGCGPALDDAFVRLGEALLVHERKDLPALMSRVPASRPATRAECLRRLAVARDFLHGNAHRSLTLDEMAGSACLSPYHFHRLFKAVHGATPQQYLTRLRVHRARRLLRDSRLPVIQIALQVGFESAAAFTRRFTALEGVPPVQYRRSLER